MDFKTLFVVSIIALIGALIYVFVLRHDRDKYLFMCKPLQRERDKLQEDLESAKKLLANSEKKSSNGKSNSNNDNKSEKSVKNADVDALNEKIRELKSDISRIKEENFNLKKDNKSLRKDMRDHSESNESDQREIVDLRDRAAAIEEELRIAQNQLKSAQKVIAENAQTNTQPADKPESSPEDAEKIESLEREKASLAASLKDVRGELAGFKKDFRTELDAAKKEVAESNQTLRKELNHARRLMEQSKKRADNNHKIYLIARAQMQLAEKRLALFDAKYQSPLALPASNDAIDEVIKKFNTVEARGAKASNDIVTYQKTIDDLRQRISSLESENAELKSKKSDDVSFGSLTDDSLSSLMGDLTKNNNTAQSGENTPSLTGLNAGDLADFDLSKMDDDWDSV